MNNLAKRWGLKLHLTTPFLLIVACYGLLFGPGHAANSVDSSEPVKYYDVEVIVFKNNLVPHSPEFNLPTPSATRTEKTLDLSSPQGINKANDMGFIPLTAEELRLQDMVNHIIKSSRYELLTHIGWRQPGLNDEQSLPVWLRGGRVFGDGYSSIDQATASQADEITPLSETSMPTEPVNSDLYELEGQVTITLARYLHTHAELVLRKPVATEDVLNRNEALLTATDDLDLLELEGRLLLNYGLDEQRRMRSNKLHYLDHPEFSLLVLITPYKPPEEVSNIPVNEAQPVIQDPPGTG